MNGDHRTPRRSLASTASLAAAGLFVAASLVIGFSTVAAPVAPAGPEPVPAAPALEESLEDWYQQDLPEDGWLWDDDAIDDGFDDWPAAPDEDVSPFAATTSDDPLNFLAEIFPAV